MSGSARNFRSGRDRTEERQPPSKIRKQNVYSGIEQRRSDSRVWSDFEENHSEYPAQEPLHGNRFVQKDDRRKLVRERSPGFDRWGGENKSHSPTESWDPPQRGKGMSQGRSRSRDRRTSRSRSRGRARSRSRSRGRARDRSQSPFEVHRRVAYGTIDRSGNRMMSSQPCKYFASGMCRKGSQCTFFHPDNNLGSRDGSKYYEKNDLEQPRRRGSRLEYNRDEVEFSDNYERGGSRDYDLKRQQPIRKPFCKDFGLGKCNRDNCRFSHDDPTADDRRVQNHDERTKSWNGPTWDDYNKTSDSVNASGGWGEKVHDPMVGEGRGDDRRGRNLEIKEAFATKSTGWGEGSVKNSRFHDHDDPIAVENRGDDRRQRNPNEKSKVWNGPTWDDDAKETWDATKTTGWGDNSVVKTKLQDPMAAEQRGDDRWDRNLDRKNESWYEVKDTSDAAKLTDDDKWGSNLDDKTKPANAPSTIDDVKGILDTVKAGGWGDGIGRISTFHDPMAADERGLHIIQGSSQFQSDEISARGNKQNLTLETGALQTSIRGHENSHNIAVIEDSSARNAVKVSDPIDSGAHLISSNGHNIDLNEVPFQNVNPETEAETLPKETGKTASEVLDIVTPHEVSQNVLNPKVDGTIDGKQEQENVDGKIEESNNNNNNNTSKDEKAMRVFKIALVELVKEILKPKWKDGQMSREVHKTIVKKTVDKVSSTIPGDQVPNTQEKISQYLSISKAKITKLVQAYVERFSKT